MSNTNSPPSQSSTSRTQIPLTPGVMKQLVIQIDDQIAALQTQIDLAEGYQEAGIDGGYQRQIDFANWIENRRDKFDGGNVPTLNAIAFVKSILDVLVEAEKPLTEKAIKALCTPYCKDLGVRVTMKGGIVGQILDVNMVCGVLEALGLVEVKVHRMAKSELEVENTSADHPVKDNKIDVERYKSRNEDVPLCKALVDRWQWLMDTYLRDVLSKKSRGPTGKSVGRPSTKKKNNNSNNDNMSGSNSSSSSNYNDISSNADSSGDRDNGATNIIDGSNVGADEVNVKAEYPVDDSFEKEEYDEEEEEEEEEGIEGEEVEEEGEEEEDEEEEEEEEEEAEDEEGASDEASGENIDDSLEEQEGSGDEEDGFLEGDEDGSDIDDAADDTDMMMEVEKEVKEEKAPVTISSMLGSMMPRIPWSFGTSSSSSSQKVDDPATPASSTSPSSSSSMIKKEKKSVTEDDDTVSTDSGFKESPELDVAKKGKDGQNCGDGRGREASIGGDKRAALIKTISLVDRTKNPVIDNTVDAETFYLDMSQTVYDEALALEQEEGVLRRLAGQCGITIPSSSSFIPGAGVGNFRLGTNYLSSKYRHSAGGQQKRWDSDIPMTGSQLWAKAKANAPKKKFDFRSSISWGSNHPIFDESGKQPGAGRLRPVNFDNVFNKKHFIKPAYLKQYDPALMPLPAPPPGTTCKPTGESIVMPDLFIRTSHFPWNSIAAEFVPYEEDHMDDGMDFDAIHSGEIKKKKRGRRKVSEEVEAEEEQPEEGIDEEEDDSDESDDESIEASKPPPLVRSASTGIDLLAPAFREVTPIVYGMPETGNGSKNKKSKLDGEEDEDISDEAIERRHEKGLADMREKWQTISKLKEELRGEKMAMGRGGNGMMKFGVGVGRGSPGRKKKRIGRPSKQGNPNWGKKNADGSPSPRKRGRPPSKNIPVPVNNTDDDPNLATTN